HQTSRLTRMNISNRPVPGSPATAALEAGGAWVGSARTIGSGCAPRTADVDELTGHRFVTWLGGLRKAIYTRAWGLGTCRRGGHETPVPLAAALQDPRLGCIVDIVNAEALAIPRGPLEVVEQ